MKRATFGFTCYERHSLDERRRIRNRLLALGVLIAILGVVAAL